MNNDKKIQGKSRNLMDTLKPKQIKAILLLIQGKTKRETAKSIKVAPETISKWCSDPFFMAAVSELQLEIVDGAVNKLRLLAGKAAETLEGLIDNASSDAVRLRASLAVLDMLGIGDSHKFAKLQYDIGETNPLRIVRQNVMDKAERELSDKEQESNIRLRKSLSF